MYLFINKKYLLPDNFSYACINYFWLRVSPEVFKMNHIIYRYLLVKNYLTYKTLVINFPPGNENQVICNRKTPFLLKCGSYNHSYVAFGLTDNNYQSIIINTQCLCVAALYEILIQFY